MSEAQLQRLLGTFAPTFPIYLPQDQKQFPAIVYTVVATDAVDTICGRIEEQKRVQIDCYASTYGQLQAVRNQVLYALRDFEKLNDFDGLVENSPLFSRSLEFYI